MLSLLLGTDGGAAQSQRVDPVLEHLMRNARSDAVRQEFLRSADTGELIDDHDIRLLVSAVRHGTACFDDRSHQSQIRSSMLLLKLL